MTENEAIYVLEMNRPFAYSELQEAIDTAINSLKEIKQYRAIGTVEEFRNLKYKKNVLPIATIKFSKEDMQKIVDEKVSQIELNIQEIRNKAIDEFAEALKEKAEEIMKNPDIMLDCKKCTIWNVRDIDEIAEQLKAGGENE